jgi:hypothetical protein
MPDEKGDNFGAGLPQGLLADIDGLLSGPGAKGTPAEQAATYRALALEENAALHPGRGTTSMIDATLKYLAVAQAKELLVAAATAADATTAINKLAPALQALGKQWSDFGPVRDAFLDSIPKPK